MGIFDAITNRPCPECEKLKAELKKYKTPPAAAELLSKSISGSIKSAAASAETRMRQGVVLLTRQNPAPQATDSGIKGLAQELQAYYSCVAKSVHKFNGEVDRFNLFGTVNLFFGEDGLGDALFAAQEIFTAGRQAFPRGGILALFPDPLFSGVMGDPEIRMDFVTIGATLIEVQEALPAMMAPGRILVIASPDLKDRLAKAFPGESINEGQLPSGRKVLIAQKQG